MFQAVRATLGFSKYVLCGPRLLLYKCYLLSLTVLPHPIPSCEFQSTLDTWHLASSRRATAVSKDAVFLCNPTALLTLILYYTYLRALMSYHIVSSSSETRPSSIEYLLSTCYVGAQHHGKLQAGTHQTCTCRNANVLSQ